MEFYFGQIVYHEDVKNGLEPLIVRIIETKRLFLEGNLSGSTPEVPKGKYFPISGVSTIKNASYLIECRKTALDIEALAVPVDWNKDNMTRTCRKLLDMVLILTNEVNIHESKDRLGE